jgi:hypothetical protein
VKRKTSPASAKLKLWAIELCPANTEPGMTIVLMAPTLRLALQAAERRYPMRFCDGSRGHGVEADHAAFNWGDRTFDTVQAGAWWGSGYLPTGRGRG